MVDFHKAIRAKYDTVVSINGDTEETIVAKDKDGNNVTIDWTSIKSWVDPNEYVDKRVKQYPSILEFIEAYTEKEIGGNSTKWDAYKTAYNKVRTDNPKE
jgi:hypothetical protein